MEWLDVKAYKEELTKAENLAFRTKLIQGLKKLKDQVNATHFYWYFEPSDEIEKGKSLPTLNLKICTPNVEETTKKTKTHFADYKCIIKKDDQKELEKLYGKEGLQAFHNTMNAICNFWLLKEKNYVNMNETTLIHFLMNSAGFYFPQEAIAHLDLFIARMTTMLAYENFETFRQHILKVVDQHLLSTYKEKAK